MNEQLVAVVIGSSGLIGSHVLSLLLEDPAFSLVRILVRSAIGTAHPKLEQVIVNFNDEFDYRNKLGSGNVIFCCIGTTQQKVKGDKVAYEKIDFQIPFDAARFGKQAGFSSLLLVSSVGSNADSKNFYLRLKGKTEKVVAAVNLKCVHIFRPSMLLGDRAESRPGESAGKAIMQAFSFLFVGSFKKYKPIHARRVAAAMVRAAKNDVSGLFIYEYGKMIQ